MKQKIKKIFENAVWWSGVVMVGLILGVSLQFVRAWTEPTDAPPGGNVGAPINTGNNLQQKSGSLALLGQLITSYINIPGNVPAAGNVLTAQNAAGQVAWAAGGGGGCFTYYCNKVGASRNVCTDKGGMQGYCPSEFQQKYAMGIWGFCDTVWNGQPESIFLPPGGACAPGWSSNQNFGEAYVCCQ